LAWSLDEIYQEVNTMQNDQKQIKNDIFKLCWYMRGGVTLDEGFALSIEDRKIIASIIEENLETTKKSGMPFF
jgi:hypothetical protein